MANHCIDIKTRQCTILDQDYSKFLSCDFKQRKHGKAKNSQVMIYHTLFPDIKLM